MTQGATSYEGTRAEAERAVAEAGPSADAWLSQAESWVEAGLPADMNAVTPQANHAPRE